MMTWQIFDSAEARSAPDAGELESTRVVEGPNA